MSDDDYFDDELDSAFINEVEAIEAAHIPPSAPAAASRPAPGGSVPTSKFKSAQPAMRLPPHKQATHISSSASRPASVAKASSPRRASASHIIELDDSSDYGDAFDDVIVDDAALAQFDAICQRELDIQHGRLQPPANPVPGPSRANGLVRRPSKGAQLTLFGDVANDVEPAKAAAPPPRQFQRTRSRQMPLAGQAKKTKQWDRTAYAKTGWRKPKANPDKGKGRTSDDEAEEEAMEFEQFPAPEVPVG